MVSSTLILALTGLSTFSEAAPFLAKRDGSSKLGYAFGKNNAYKIETFNPNSGCWGYSWEAKVTDTGYSIPNCEFVPMLHDDKEMFVTAWTTFQDAQKAIDAGAKHMLSFNEPDQCGENTGGACIQDAGTAAQRHKELIDDVYAGKGIKIGAPAVTNGETPTMGISYLKNFLSKCDGCQIDFVCAHWQWDDPVAPEFSKFTDHITKMHKETGKPVWVTEFQAPSASPDPVEFMRKAAKWMDEQDFVERYAYFSVDSKLTSGSALSDLGVAYSSL